MIAAIQSNDYNVTISLAFIYSVMYIVLMLVVERPVRNYRPENPSGEEIGLRGDGMKKRSDEKTDEKMTGGDVASVREHVLSPEEYLSQIEFWTMI